MNNRRVVGDSFSFGMVTSFYWHIFWALLIIPVLNMPFRGPAESQTVFLGDILKDSDFTFSPLTEKPASQRPVGRSHDLSRESYFGRGPREMRKPALLLAPLTSAEEKEAPPAASPVASQGIREVSFGPKDSGEYVENMDLTEMKRYSSNDDLSNSADFRVFLTQDGRVAQIKKVAGSGDPAVDLTIMRKLKKAVFRPIFAKGVWVSVRFNIK